MRTFKKGDRVLMLKHADWKSDIIGTVASPPSEPRRLPDGTYDVVYGVDFDEPQTDLTDEADGKEIKYEGATVLERFLKPLAETAIDMLADLRAIQLHLLYTPQEWDDIFARLVSAVGSEHKEIALYAIERVAAALDAERMQTYRQTGFVPKAMDARIAPIMLAIENRERTLRGSVAEFCYYIRLGDDGKLSILFQRWLERLAASRLIDEATKLAALIRFKTFGNDWNNAYPNLLHLLDHDDLTVRAVAASEIGNLYVNGDPPIPLSETMELIRQKELERPGIAGSFFGAIYWDFNTLKEQCPAPIDLAGWFFDIIERRKTDEPSVHHYNGIDFYAHELFSGAPDYIRRLIHAGKEDIAIEAATEICEKIDALEPILIELGNHPDEEIAIRACWHLASYYNYSHPRGVERGWVKLIEMQSPFEMNLIQIYHAQNRERPFAETIYPRLNDFTTDNAWDVLERIAPPEKRGAKAPNLFSPDESANPFVLGNEESYTFERCFVTLRGDPQQKIWKSVAVHWRNG